MNKQWLEERKDKYLYEVAKEANVHERTISRWERKYGVSVKRMTPKEASEKAAQKKIEKNKITFFDKINSEEKAYFLGLLLADGYNNSGNRAQLELNKKDKNILENFKLLIPQITLREKSQKKPHMLVLSINSSYCVKSLEKLGFIKNKTKILEVPKIDKNFYADFYRGFFDGDGHIGEKQANFPSGSIKFVEQSLEIWKNLGINTRKVYVKKENDYIRVILNRRNHEILDFMYGNNPKIVLERKLIAYKSFWENYSYQPKKRSRS